MYSTREFETLFTVSSNLDLLKELVAMDSQVGNTSGILRVQLFLRNILTGMGLQVELVDNPQKETAPLLIASKKGTIGSETITFIGHSDVVTSARKNPIRIESDKLFGAGVADDKGGLVVCISALQSFLKKHSDHHFNINVVVSPNEETGSIGFHEIFRKIGKRSDYIFGLEPALHCGSVINCRSGNRWYNFQVNGISAHAGRFGGEYINAAHKLSLLVAKMHILNDETKKRRVNVGSFSGGSGGYNTICGKAEAKIDVRFSTFECREFLHEQIEKIIEETAIECPYSGKKSSVLYSIEDDCPPLGELPQGQYWYQALLKDICTIENRSVEGAHAGGAADINYFAFPGKKLLDGLGPIGGGMHTLNEYIELDSLETRSLALGQFLMRLNYFDFSGRDTTCKLAHSQI